MGANDEADRINTRELPVGTSCADDRPISRRRDISATVATTLGTEGGAIFPRSVQVGRSYNVMIDFDLSAYACDNAATNAGACCRQLEVELQAAGIAVDGEEQLRLCTDSPLPVGIWNCYFPSIGHNTVNLLLREVKSPRNVPGGTPDDAREVIFVHKTDVKVYGVFAGSNQALLTLVISGFAAITPFTALKKQREHPFVHTGAVLISQGVLSRQPLLKKPISIRFENGGCRVAATYRKEVR